MQKIKPKSRVSPSTPRRRRDGQLSAGHPVCIIQVRVVYIMYNVHIINVCKTNTARVLSTSNVCCVYEYFICQMIFHIRRTKRCLNSTFAPPEKNRIRRPEHSAVGRSSCSIAPPAPPPSPPATAAMIIYYYYYCYAKNVH